MPIDRAVSTTAISAATMARPMISRLSGWGPVRLLMIERKSSGLTMPTNASTVTSTRNHARIAR